MLEKSAARVVIHAGTGAGFNPPPGIEVVQLDVEWPGIAGQFSGNPPPLATPENLIYIIFTSGSTGRPKGAAIRHGGFTNLLDWYVADLGISGTDRVLVCSSISFDLTQKNILAPLLTGGTLYFSPTGTYDAALSRPFDPGARSVTGPVHAQRLLSVDGKRRRTRLQAPRFVAKSGSGR